MLCPHKQTAHQYSKMLRCSISTMPQKGLKMFSDLGCVHRQHSTMSCATCCQQARRWAGISYTMFTLNIRFILLVNVRTRLEHISVRCLEAQNNFQHTDAHVL